MIEPKSESGEARVTHLETGGCLYDGLSETP